MIAKVEMVGHPNIVMPIFRILQQIKMSIDGFLAMQPSQKRLLVTYPFHQLFQNFDLNQCLRMKPLLVANDLYSQYVSCSMVKTLDNLSKRTFSHDLQNLIAICKVILADYPVISSIVIISEIASRLFHISLMLLGLRTNKIHLGKFQYLGLFIRCKVWHVKLKCS